MNPDHNYSVECEYCSMVFKGVPDRCPAGGKEGDEGSRTEGKESLLNPGHDSEKGLYLERYDESFLSTSHGDRMFARYLAGVFRESSASTIIYIS